MVFALVKTDTANKTSNQMTRPGCVTVKGQILSIRIVQRTAMPTGNTYKYRYEVIDPESEHFKELDFIYYEEYLSRHTRIQVQLNDDQNYPRIIEVLGDAE